MTVKEQPSVEIDEDEIIESVADALQFISYYHSADFIRHLTKAWLREESSAARNAMGQILRNSRMCAIGHRPICQDTGTANIFMKVGMNVRIRSDRSLQEIVDDATRRAYRFDANPLRASMVLDPLGSRRNSGDNTPAMLSTELVAGNTISVDVSAKGGGSENKARFAVLEPSESICDWVVSVVESLGAGWCPPGVLGLGIGGNAEKAMLLAKEALNQKLDITELIARGPSSAVERLRLQIYERVNALGIGAQGLGGLSTVLDVQIKTLPTHAASLPVALIPNCAAMRHIDFVLDGTGPASFDPPSIEDWPEISPAGDCNPRSIDLDQLDSETISSLLPGETLLLSGTLFTGRDAAHKRMIETIRSGGALPVDMHGKAIYYVGPVDPAAGEIIGPAGPTTSTRMDRFTNEILAASGLKVMIGKAERGSEAIEAIKRHNAVYLIAVGGAAYLVSKAIKSAQVVAYPDLGMEAIFQMRVEDMPVLVAVDCRGQSIHTIGPRRWRRSVDSSRP